MKYPLSTDLPSVEKVGLRERLGLKDLRLDLGVVEVDSEGFCSGGRCDMGRVRGQGAGADVSPRAGVVSVTPALG